MSALTHTVRDLHGATLEIEVVVAREFRVRMWIALRLIALAARVLRCGIEVKQ